FLARTNCGVEFIMVGNVVAMQALRACLKIGRRISIGHAQGLQIRHDLARLGKREPAIELQSVGRTGNARMLFCCHFERSRETISNDKIQMTNDETNPNEQNPKWR